MELKLVQDNQIPNGYVPEERKLDKNAIPDLEKLLDTVLNLVRYINTDKMQKFENDNPTEFEYHLKKKFESLNDRYESIFKLLLDKNKREDNLAKLIDMFSKLNKIKSGELDIKKESEQFEEEQREEYVYPNFGGKEGYAEYCKNNNNNQNNKL